jgi:acetylornithine/N-succinyldiaminopimelate aminotransferase
MALEMEDAQTCKSAIDRCIEGGLVTDWFLFAPHCIRISPPLTISDEEIRKSCDIIRKALS